MGDELFHNLHQVMADGGQQAPPNPAAQAENLRAVQNLVRQWQWAQDHPRLAGAALIARQIPPRIRRYIQGQDPVAIAQTVAAGAAGMGAAGLRHLRRRSRQQLRDNDAAIRREQGGGTTPPRIRHGIRRGRNARRRRIESNRPAPQRLNFQIRNRTQPIMARRFSRRRRSRRRLYRGRRSRKMRHIRRRARPGNRLGRPRPFRLGTGFPNRISIKHRFLTQILAANVGGELEWNGSGHATTRFNMNNLIICHNGVAPAAGSSARWFDEVVAAGYNRYRINGFKATVKTRYDCGLAHATPTTIKTVVAPIGHDGTADSPQPTNPSWDHILERRMSHVTTTGRKTSTLKVFYKPWHVQRQNKILWNIDEGNFGGTTIATAPSNTLGFRIELVTRDGGDPLDSNNIYVEVELVYYTVWDRQTANAGQDLGVPV